MASNLLWAHLLRKDVATTDATPSQIPPIAPQDKTGTTMRMLIHDTQANLEKFSTRLDALFSRVDDCRAQIVNANKLLDVERDKVLSEILEIAHRSQSEMKTHVGTPAQASALELVHLAQVSSEKSVQALEKRIDALQALLQTQAHAMQSIQDQQNTLIGAVLPLVPVIHGISPQMDQVKTALSDVVANAVSTVTNSVESARSALVVELAQNGSSSKSASSSRRTLLEPHGPTSSPLGGRGHSLKRARAAHHAGDAQLPHKLSRLTVPNPGDPPILRTPRTPRQPLTDLLLVPGSNTSRMNSASHRRMRLRGAAISPPVSRPPLQPLDDPTIARPLHDMPLAVDILGTAGGVSKAIKIEEILEANFSGIISIRSSPQSSPPSSLPTRHDTVASVHPSQAAPLDHDAPTSMSLRDRRAQMSKFGRSETRRFIPLVPWSDEE